MMPSVLKDLNDAIDRGSQQSRLEALRHATDLLIAGQYAEDEIWTLGDVIERLAAELEGKVRAELSERLARSPNAPFQTLRSLAMDDAIEVAGPVLQHASRLDLRTLRACARSKGQQHLLAIAQRRSIPEAVTDILVQRGDQAVVRTTAANEGARFSEKGFLHLLKRSEDDSILAENLGTRRDIPRHVFQQLIAKASEEVRARIASAMPDRAAALDDVVVEATGALHAKFGPANAAYFAAKKAVTSLFRSGALGEARIADYARAHQLEETIVGLSLLCSLPADVVERSLTSRRRDTLLMLARSLAFSWDTTMALLFVGAPDNRMPSHRLEELKREYERLDIAAAREILSTYDSRRSAAVAKGEQRRLPQLHRT